MAFDKKAALQGSEDFYQVHPNAKKYTLRDNGFEETPSGNFQFIRSLENAPASKQGVKLKVIISSDLQQLKLSTITGNGLRSVNLYKGSSFEAEKEKVAFTFQDFVERGVLVKL